MWQGGWVLGMIGSWVGGGIMGVKDSGCGREGGC